MFFRRPLAGGLLLAAIVSTVMFATVACGDDDDDADTGDADYTAVVAAISFTSGAGLHGIDESINQDDEIPSNARTTALRVQTVLSVTDWPDELQSQADALVGIMGELASALDGDAPDMAAAGTAAERAHDGEHDFSNLVWDYLYEAAGIEGGGEGH